MFSARFQHNFILSLFRYNETTKITEQNKMRPIEKFYELQRAGLTNKQVATLIRAFNNPKLDVNRPALTLFLIGYLDPLYVLIRENKIDSEVAVNELCGLRAGKAYLLAKYFPIGLRKHHLNSLDSRCNVSESTFTAFETLFSTKDILLDDIFFDLRQLSNNQIKILAKFYQNGLRGDHLRSWVGESHHFNFHGGFNRALQLLLVELKFSPVAAMRELNHLCEEKADVLSKLFRYGLRGAHLLEWKPNKAHTCFSLWHSGCLVYLIEKCEFEPSEAIKKINGLCELEAQELYLSYYPQEKRLLYGRMFYMKTGAIPDYADVKELFANIKSSAQ